MPTYFNDERDLCFSCRLPPESCDNGAICRFKEYRNENWIKREKSAKIQNSVGFPDKPLWKLGDRMNKFSEDVAKYTEPFMEREREMAMKRGY